MIHRLRNRVTTRSRYLVLWKRDHPEETMLIMLSLLLGAACAVWAVMR